MSGTSLSFGAGVPHSPKLGQISTYLTPVKITESGRDVVSQNEARFSSFNVEVSGFR